MNEGWIKLQRQWREHWTYSCKPFDNFHAWLDLLLSANHKDANVLIDGKVKLIKRGSFHTSIQQLSEKWGWDRKKASRFLMSLERDEMVTTERTTHGTTITLVNYGKYQDEGTTDRPTNSPTTTPTDGQPLPTNKNNNNNKNEKNKYIARFEPPTLEEVKKFCEGRENGIDPEEFINHYEAIGWKIGKNPMKDWRAAVRTWERRNKTLVNGRQSSADSARASFEDPYRKYRTGMHS